MRKKIVAGNWKMNHTAEEAYDLARKMEKYAVGHIQDQEKEMIISPPFPFLEAIENILHLLPNVQVAAQNCHWEEHGAYTGEVAAGMLKSIGVRYVIIGHSERRAYFQEDNALLKQKVDRAITTGLRPIFCCGEQEAERDSGNHKAFVEGQLESSLFHLSGSDIQKCVIAYEPVWAIGTGKTATPQQAQEMHSFIRFLIANKYSDLIADDMTILYGGSCKPSNAAEIFSGKDVDGGLIGGASLNAKDFIAIIEAL